MFYTYNQNNSGGIFDINDRVGQYVIIEADNCEKANEKAETVGIYFDGCDNDTDCSCCGDRWHRNYEEGNKQPQIYGKTIKEYKDDLDYYLDYYIGPNLVIHIYYKNNNHETIKIDAKAKIEENKKKQRDKAKKIWGIGFNLYGLWDTKPVRLYESKGFDKNNFWDKSGNLSVDKIGFDTSNAGCMTFSSESKKEVEEFIKEIQASICSAIDTVRERPKTLATEAVIKRLGGMLGTIE